MSRCAIYSRFSTDRQNETSIEDQVRVAEEYAAKHGFTIAGQYTDEGISGTALGNRPGIQSVIEGAVSKAFDVLLVRDIQRVARGEDLPPLIKRLKFRNVRVVGVLDGFDSSADGARMRTNMEGMMGAEYIETVRRLTHSGLKMRAGNGHHTGGSVYGYTTVPDGRYFKRAVLAEEADVVREVFGRYAAGESQKAIARDLTARGIPSPRGRAWYVSAVHAMLHNPRYTGRFVWNMSEWRKDPDTGKRIRIERPESEWVVTQQEDLRLVSDETWQRVRARDTPSTMSHNARPKYALSGLLLCAECGRAMTLSGGKNSRGFGSQRYVCPSYREHGKGALGGCSNDMAVSRLTAEELIIEPLRERLLGDQNFLNAVSALQKNEDPKNSSLVSCVSRGDRGHRDSGKASITGSDWLSPGTEGDDAHGDGHHGAALLAARLAAIESAAACGAMTQREAASRCAALRAEHERALAHTLRTDEASIVANAERLRAALVSAATDALRDALRRTLGTVRCRPTVEGESRYLLAQFEGGDAALLEWLAIGDLANQPGLSALVAGDRFLNFRLALAA